MDNERDAAWYAENFGRGQELWAAAKEATAAAEHARVQAAQATSDARALGDVSEIFEGFPLLVDIGDFAGWITSPLNRFSAYVYIPVTELDSNRWYVHLEDRSLPGYDTGKLMPEGGKVFHLRAGVSKEQALEEAKRWVAVREVPAGN